MRLFLASEGKHPNTIREIDKFVGGIKGKNIAYIPTASNGEIEWGGWRKGETWKLLKTLGANIEIVELENYRNESVAKVLKSKDIVWFAGGMAGYLAYWMRRCSLDINLIKLFENGIVYVGSSAGAMVLGKSLEIAAFGFVDNERGAEEIKGMGIVDFDIYPHYEDDMYEDIKKNYKGKKLYLLKNGEEIIVEDAKITVIGEERLISR